MGNFKKWMVLSGLGIAVAGGLTGCAEMHEREARNTGRTTAQVVTDDATDRRVKDALHNSPIYKFPGVGVQTFNSVVQLNGFVDSDNQKRAAEDITKTVPGVQRVVNNIAIKAEVAPTGRTDGAYRAPIINSNQEAPQPQTAPQTEPPPPQNSANPPPR
jgi:hypothetical protein